jgi:hypothetical protein
MKSIVRFLAVVCLLVSAAILSAQPATYVTVPDIVGTGATVQLSATSTKCIMVQFNALPTNLSLVRWGGAATSISQGAFLAAGGGQTEWWSGSGQPINLAAIYVYVATGDKVAVTCKQ